MDNKPINPQAIVALKEALTNIYWYKNDLKSFVFGVLGDSPLLVNINWEDYKRSIVHKIIDQMTINQSRYRQELINLMVTVASMDDFSHLERLDDGKLKAQTAKQSVASLRHHTQSLSFINNEQKIAEERRQAYSLKLQQTSVIKNKLAGLYEEYVQLTMATDKQARGYKLEKMLKELFDLFDLDPKASFRIVGEQIDGAFAFENSHFLFEAKWHEQLVSADALDSFAGKVKRKFDAKGLFLSINGFSQDGVSAHSSGEKVLLLIDGSDLMAVLDGRIDLKELLSRKRKQAAQTGQIYYTYREMVS